MAEIARRGLKLLNLCQLPSGIWRANLTDYQQCWKFGEAASAEEALLAAIRALELPSVPPIDGIESSSIKTSGAKVRRPSKVTLDDL